MGTRHEGRGPGRRPSARRKGSGGEGDKGVDEGDEGEAKEPGVLPVQAFSRPWPPIPFLGAGRAYTSSSTQQSGSRAAASYGLLVFARSFARSRPVRRRALGTPLRVLSRSSGLMPCPENAGARLGRPCQNRRFHETRHEPASTIQIWAARSASELGPASRRHCQRPSNSRPAPRPLPPGSSAPTIPNNPARDMRSSDQNTNRCKFETAVAAHNPFMCILQPTAHAHWLLAGWLSDRAARPQMHASHPTKRRTLCVLGCKK